MTMSRTQITILSEYLVLDAQSGSRDALSQLVKLWNPKLTRRAYRLTGDHEGTHEVIQETWVGIAKGLRSLRDPSRFGGWAYRIVQHKSADWIQQRSRDRTLNSDLRNTAASRAPEPADDHAHTIRAAIAHLDPKLREVVYLFYMDNCTIDQIAIVLSIPPGTAKTRLSAARSQLKAILQRTLERSTQ
jgi:RNA polymerase sigma factor (sigma-70 family)